MTPSLSPRASILIGCVTVAMFVSVGLTLWEAQPVLAALLLVLGGFRLYVLAKQIRGVR